MAPRYRLPLLIGIVFTAYTYLLFHLYNLQVAKGKYYLAKAESQVAASDMLAPARGGLFFTDKNGNHLAVATNKDFPLIYAVPKVVTDPRQTSIELAPIVGMSVADLEKKLMKPNDAYEELMRKAPQDVADKVNSMKLKGVYTEDVSERYYPFNKLAAHVLGYLGPDNSNGETGHYGLEELYNDELGGTPGTAKGAKVVNGPEAGEDINLTIDPNIQTEAERILGDLVGKFNAPSGNVIVEESKTGKILAMASLPTFDPNNYKEYPIADYLNPVTQKLYEPGSVVKVLTMAAGIDLGAITPKTTFNDKGYVMSNGRKIEDWDKKPHGIIDMTYVIEHSLNVGAVFAEQKIGGAALRDYLMRFGFGAKTGIDLPGELKGDIRNITVNASPVAYATASFGQGIAVTPLQLVNAIAALANKGTLMRPYVNADLQPQVIRAGIIKPETADQVTGMMVKALDGIDTQDKFAGYTLAGKTGTAQVADLRHGGYSDKVVDTYVGFGPVADPRFVILIKMDEPPGNVMATESVIPAFRNLAQFILNYYDVPPDNLNSNKQ